MQRRFLLLPSMISILTTEILLTVCVFGTEQGPKEAGSEQDWPGVIVACTPDDPDNKQLTCMHVVDANCPVRDHYIRTARCARAWGGTPSDYPQAKLASGYQNGFDCYDLHGLPPNYPTKASDPEIRQGHPMDLNARECDDCQVCLQQMEGWGVAQFPDDRWHELQWCPDGSQQNDLNQNADIVHAWCELLGDPVPTTSDGDDDSGDDPPPPMEVWLCNGSPQVCGVMLETKEGWAPSPVESCMSDNYPDCVFATESTAAGRCTPRSKIPCSLGL